MPRSEHELGADRAPGGAIGEGYDDTVYRCDECGETFSGKEELVEHGRRHVEPGPQVESHRRDPIEG